MGWGRLLQGAVRALDGPQLHPGVQRVRSHQRDGHRATPPSPPLQPGALERPPPVDQLSSGDALFSVGSVGVTAPILAASGVGLAVLLGVASFLVFRRRQAKKPPRPPKDHEGQLGGPPAPRL